MRKTLRRSFTVEHKSAGRNSATTMPTRVIKPIARSPRAVAPLAAEPSPQAEEKRRILPNLIVPEVPQVEPEVARRDEDQPEPKRRGRPRKAPLAMAATDAEVAALQPVPVPQEPQDTPAAVRPLQVRQARPASAFPLGERWKRRLSRWSR